MPGLKGENRELGLGGRKRTYQTPMIVIYLGVIWIFIEYFNVNHHTASDVLTQ